MEGRKKEVFSLHKFLVVFRMLFREKSRLSFRSDLKGTLVKLTSLLVLFAVLIALSYGAYYLAASFNIFSSVFYVPLAVPSIVMAFLFLFGFFALLSGLRRSLFLSPDNKILLTYPCTGSTVFLTRLAVYFVHELGRNFLVQFPLLLGYMMVMGAPGYLYPWLVFALTFLSVFEVMLASLLAIPYHLVASFLEERPRLREAVLLVLDPVLLEQRVHVGEQRRGIEAVRIGQQPVHPAAVLLGYLPHDLGVGFRVFYSCHGLHPFSSIPPFPIDDTGGCPPGALRDGNQSTTG